MKKYFELNRPYEFDPTDLTAIIFTVCSVLGIATSINITPLFLLGSLIGFATCFKARRINLIALNGSLLILNLVNFIKMFQCVRSYKLLKLFRRNTSKYGY